MHDYTISNGYPEFFNYCKNIKIDYVISNYSNNFEYDIIRNGLTNIRIPIATIPNLINTNIFKNYNIDKCYDILIYGNMAGCYPFRRRMLKILEENTSNWKVRIIKFNELTTQELSKEINKSYLSVATKSIYDYLVCKYFEIPFSNSLIVGDMPIQGYEIFKEYYLDINNNMNDEEIICKITDFLNNKDMIIKKIEELNDKLFLLSADYKIYYHIKAMDYFLNNQL